MHFKIMFCMTVSVNELLSKSFNKSLERRHTKMDTEEYGCFFKWKNRHNLDFIWA